MNTVLAPPGVVPGRRATLDEEEQHHLRVRRAQGGDVVGLRDGAGLVGTGRLVSSGRSWLVDVETVERRAPPAPLVLAVGAGDRERFGWLVEKAAELGVTAVVPLETVRSADVSNRLRDGHIVKLRRRALEAIKQCGAAWALELEAPLPLADFLARPADGLRWLADGEGEATPSALDRTPVRVVIGPEGGLAAEERSALGAAGFRSVTLGPSTLRFETAALAAAAAVVGARLRGSNG